MSTGLERVEELADELDRARVDIIDRWLHRVRRRQLATRPLPALELVDSLPEFLAHLSAALRRGLPAEDDEAGDSEAGTPADATARVHGVQRYRHGFDVRAIVLEYTILLDVLLEFFAGAGRRMDLQESRVIVRAIALGIAAAVDQFSAQREADVQTGQAALMRAREYERELIGVVAHDLRNPLGVIMMCADIATRGGDLPERATQALGRLRSNADRALRLISDLLDFTQVRSMGRIPVRPEAADMEELVQVAIDEAALTHPDRTIERVGVTAPVRGRWDADRIAQVLANLLDNALKFSPPGSAVRVETRADGERVAVTVHNEGPPIPSDRLRSVFEPFQRVDPGNGPRRSLGLGLHISRQIAEAHGGGLEVESSAEHGTSFTLTLPRTCSVVEPAAAAGERGAAGRTTQ